MTGCLVKGCLSLAKWLPVVFVTTSGNDNKFRLDFKIPVCDTCKEKLGLKEIVPTSSLEAIQNMFRYSNLCAPSYENMVLGWEAYIPESLEVVTTDGRKLGRLDVRMGD